MTPTHQDDDTHRSYGVDASEAGEALVEATLRDDGTTHLTLVWVPSHEVEVGEADVLGDLLAAGKLDDIPFDDAETP